jgi:parallel beta-helix repeat protein
MLLGAGAGGIATIAMLLVTPALCGTSAQAPEAVSIADFGARSGVTFDSTAAVTRAIRVAAASGRGVYVPEGRYHIREARLLNGLRSIEGPGWLVGTSAAPEGVVTTNALGARGVVDNLRIAVNVDCNNVARAGIFCVGLTNSTVSGCRVTNLSHDGGSGIRLNYPNCSGNRIENNVVALAMDESQSGFPNGLFGIQLVGETASPYGGIERGGRPVYPAVTTRANRVLRNRVTGGTHGISFFGTDEFTCADNQCERQSARNIIAGPTCRDGTITGNSCVDAGSSGVHLAFGCSRIAIERNRIRSGRVSWRLDDDGAIQAYGYCTDITIAGNEISGDWRNGIYVAYGRNISIIDNVIDGRSFSSAAIFLGSAWVEQPAREAIYTRPRPMRFDIALDTSDILLRGNVVTGGTAAIALAQHGRRRLERIRIEGGRIGEGARQYVHAYEQSPGALEGLEMIGVATPGDARRFVLPRGRRHFTRVERVPGL